MTDWSPTSPQFPPLFLGTMTQPYCGMEARSFAGMSPASGAWPAVSYVVYVPFWIPWPYPINRLWWVNGSAAGGTVDVGIYTTGGRLVVSGGSTAGAGNSAPQFVTVSPTLILPPESYYFAQVVDNTTANRINRSTALSLIQQRALGIYGQTGTFPLPSSATFATATQVVYPVCGMTLTTTGF
jgi:hypothetical protein